MKPLLTSRTRIVQIIGPIFLICSIVFVACGGEAETGTQADLSSVKTYLQDQATELTEQAETFQQAVDGYYTLAEEADFDYQALVKDSSSDVILQLQNAREAWLKASPAYEQMEGIVAGVPTLSEYDVILDAGVSGEEGGEDVVPFDLTLPDGTVLPAPGNLFGITENALWGTDDAYIVKDVVLDFDGNGTQDFGDALPDANLLKGSADALASYADELLESAQAWEPTLSDTFTALVSNVPTVKDFFDAWKTSRFVVGDTSQENDFAVISRLSDIIDNVTSWQTMYKGLSPLVKETDSDQDSQITSGLEDLKVYVDDLYQQEQGGKQFTPEEAELLGDEAQNQANTITGIITQVAGKLDVRIAQ